MRGGMMDLERFRQLIEAYGAEPARWPAAEREPARALTAASPGAAALLAEAAAIDRLLDQARLAPPIIDAEALIARATAVVQDRPAARAPRPIAASSGHRAGANDRGLWLRAASLAAAALIGFIVGATQLADTTDASAASASSFDFAGDSAW